MLKQITTLFLLAIATAVGAQSKNDTVKLADPTIFTDNGTYYLYGTGSPDGFPVYTSADLTNWQLQKQNALSKGDSYGTKGFWAPQLFKHQGKYYMVYTADEHIAIATGNSPLGLFTQSHLKSITMEGKQIDPFIFEDTDGKLYLYFVRLQNGNRVFVARLKDDLSDVDETTVTECIHAEQGWENTVNAAWPVSEGPTVIKKGSLYYLFYSANDFRNIDYAVGYATSHSPTGPWKKYTGNPILSRKNTMQNGSGHGDILVAGDKLYYVFHTHSSNTNVGRRKTAIVQLVFSEGSSNAFAVVPGSFHYLEFETTAAGK
jgi:xylan 1,4-beta-xylosidase